MPPLPVSINYSHAHLPFLQYEFHGARSARPGSESTLLVAAAKALPLQQMLEAVLSPHITVQARIVLHGSLRQGKFMI